MQLYLAIYLYVVIVVRLLLLEEKGKKIHYNCTEYERKGRASGHSSNRIDEDFLVEYILFRLTSL